MRPTTKVQRSGVSGAASFESYLIPFNGRIRGNRGGRSYTDEGNK